MSWIIRIEIFWFINKRNTWGVEAGKKTVQGISIFLQAKAAASPALPADDATKILKKNMIYET